MAIFRSDDTADEIIARVSTIEAARFYGLEPNRQGFVRCIFHNEKTASLKLYEGSGGYYCFGCGAGGNVISLVSKILGIEISGNRNNYRTILFRIDGDFRLGLSKNRPKTDAKEIVRAKQYEKTIERKGLEKQYFMLANRFRAWNDSIKYYGSESHIISKKRYETARLRVPELEYMLDDLERILLRIDNRDYVLSETDKQLLMEYQSEGGEPW